MSLYGTSLQGNGVAYAYIQTSVESQSNERLFLDGKNQGRDPKGSVI